MQRAIWPLKPVLSAAVALQHRRRHRDGPAAGAGALAHVALPRLLRLPPSRSRLSVRHPAEAPARLEPGRGPARGRDDELDPRRPRRPSLHERVRALHAGHRASSARGLRSRRRQSFPRVPALPGARRARPRALSALGARPGTTRESRSASASATPREFDAQILQRGRQHRGARREHSGSIRGARARRSRPGTRLRRRRRTESFGRPPRQHGADPRRRPSTAAPIWPIVSNTQGGPAHDERQRVLDAFGDPIRGLFAAGELGSVFGHLYMSGGNIAECFVGGRIAGREASAGRSRQAAA